MASLPSYVAAAKPVPQASRAAWFKNTAPTYAGIMLWFVFWQDIVSGSGTYGGSLAAGLPIALLGLVMAALFCHFLTYLVPGLLGMKTGLPLYVVGTSTYGVRGGFIMPGFLMGALQFGWLAVNAFFASAMICKSLGIGLNKYSEVVVPGPIHGSIAIIFTLLAVFVGLRGIQYVARVATYMPLIPLAILLILLFKTMGGLGGFSPERMIADNRAAAEKNVATKAAEAKEAEAKATKTGGTETEAKELKQLAANAKVAADKAEGWKKNADAAGSKAGGSMFVLIFLATYVVGFFATAGAAGVDFGMNNRNANDVQVGGLVGIVGATVLAGALSMLIVAGFYGGSNSPAVEMNSVNLADAIMGEGTAKIMYLLLALSAFAPACFPAFIAANSFKTTMPNVNPWLTVGAGTAVSLFLSVSGTAEQVVPVFLVIGASFGPICGAMMADYLLSGRQWAGPRAGFNPAGWISWAAGFAVGAIDLVARTVPGLSSLEVGVPCPPMAALIVGFVLYLVLAKIGLESQKLPMPQAAK